MKSLEKTVVKICVCAKCVLNGSLQLIEAVESLQGLKDSLSMNKEIEIVTNNFCSPDIHPNISPVVYINETLIEDSKSENVMSKIIESSSVIA